MGWLNEGSRIATATRSWIENEDTPVTGHDKTSHFIIALAVGCDTHAGDTDTFRVRWRVSGGTFAALGATGAIKQSSSTDLVNGNAVVSGEEGCSSGLTRQDGEEIEGANLSDSITISQDYWAEIQCAIDPGDGSGSATYEFELEVVGDGKFLGAGSATITLAADAQTFYQNTGQAAMAIAGVLNKKGFKDTGGYAMTITGNLATATIFLQAVGGYAVPIIGALSTVVTYAYTVGAHTMTITGSLVKKTTIYVGSGVVSPVGVLARKTSIYIGKAVLNIAGSLSKIVTFTQSTGGGSVGPIGTLGRVFIAGNGAVKRGVALLLKLMR